MLIGGAEDREGKCDVLYEFIRLSGRRPSICLMTVATNQPEELAATYTRAFKRLGVNKISSLHIQSRVDANEPATLSLIESSDALFFTGGDQLRITALLGGTGCEQLIHQQCARGRLIGGTSAGAAMMSNSMVLNGTSDTNPRFGTVQIGPGMDLLLGAMVDTHFSQRGRYGRLISSVAHHPQDLGVGIDENTALIVQKDEARVVGDGAVTIIDSAEISYSNLPKLEDHESLAIYGVKLHVLAAGSRYIMSKRAPVIENGKAIELIPNGNGARKTLPLSVGPSRQTSLRSPRRQKRVK